MTNEDIGKILNKYSINSPTLQVRTLEWRTQDSTKNSILFYRFRNFNDDEINLFKSRIENSNYALCITNLSSAEVIGHHLSPRDFESIQTELIDLIYPFDFSKKKLVAITGTNGKTTTVDIIRQLCVNNNIDVLTMGTLGIYKNKKCVDSSSLTTPSVLDFRKYLHQYGLESEVIALEMSSHALDQMRLGSVKFDAAGWTNLSQDHLDYHLTMENYFLAKRKILKYLKNNSKVYISYRQSELIQKIKSNQVKRAKSDSYPQTPFFKAKFNKENFDLAISILEGLNFKLNSFNVLPAPGRFNLIEAKSNKIVIDYAHTPDALKNICSEIRDTFSSYQLVVIFGCGGNRDKSKRKLMGAVASSYADTIFLTTDNPRYEDPEDIIKDIASGVSCEFEVQPNRAEAIKKAMLESVNSIILIAGKGHEDYVDIKGVKTPYSDIKEVEKWI